MAVVVELSISGRDKSTSKKAYYVWATLWPRSRIQMQR